MTIFKKNSSKGTLSGKKNPASSGTEKKITQHTITGKSKEKWLHKTEEH